MHEHVKHLLQATPAAVHERYWFISARNTIRRILRKCIVCFKTDDSFCYHYIMRNLLESQVKTSLKVFDQCGLDYADPFYCKEDARKTNLMNKWYCNFCLFSQGGHIELEDSEIFLCEKRLSFSHFFWQRFKIS